MKIHPLYPMIFYPQYRNYDWGGETLAHRFNRGGTPIPCAESWEITAADSFSSVVANGAFEGITLAELVHTFGAELLGTARPRPSQFPFSFKLLDIREQLGASTSSYAKLWYILATQPGARCATETTESPLSPGQIYLFSDGVCPIVEGQALIYEVQTAITASSHAIPLAPLTVTERPGRTITPCMHADNLSFATVRLMRPHHMRTTVRSCMALFCISGKATLAHDGPHPLTLLPGDSVLIPATQAFTLNPILPTQLLMTTL